MNPDRELVARFNGVATPLSSCPLLVDLKAVLLEVDSAGSVLLSFEPDERYLHPGGVVQGGIITAMLDFAMAFAAFTQLPLDRNPATASLTVDMMWPAPCARYLARGRIRRLGGRLGFLDAELTRDGAASPTAIATSVVVIIPAP